MRVTCAAQQTPGLQPRLLHPESSALTMRPPRLQQDVLVLDTTEIVDRKVSSTLKEIEQINMRQYSNLGKKRLVERNKPSTKVIKQNLPLFRNPRTASKVEEKV